MSLTKAEKELAALLLDMAADELGNRGCNDLYLPDTPENRLIIDRMWFDNSPSEHAEWRKLGERRWHLTSDGMLIVLDYAVARHLATRLKQESTSQL